MTQPGAAPATELPPLRQALEALLLVADAPLPEVTLAQVLDCPTAVVAGELRELAAEYAASQRGFALRHVNSGWRFYTAPACAPYVERFVRDGQQARLTQAALETLAIVAYRQPVTRGQISAIRGVNVDGVVRTLSTRGLIAEGGVDPATGAVLWETTGYFLERIGLGGLDELPPLAPMVPDLADLADLAELSDAAEPEGSQHARRSAEAAADDWTEAAADG